MIDWVQTSKSEYTNVHPSYARLCFFAKCHQHSLKYLSSSMSSYHTPPGDHDKNYALNEEAEMKQSIMKSDMNFITKYLV